VSRDSLKAAELWKATDTMWWEGLNDPNVRVIQVEPWNAEIWDGPAIKAVKVLEFAKARLTGQKAN
jgi:general stress protein 26